MWKILISDYYSEGQTTVITYTDEVDISYQLIRIQQVSTVYLLLTQQISTNYVHL